MVDLRGFDRIPVGEKIAEEDKIRLEKIDFSTLGIFFDKNRYFVEKEALARISEIGERYNEFYLYLESGLVAFGLIKVSLMTPTQMEKKYNKMTELVGLIAAEIKKTSYR